MSLRRRIGLIAAASVAAAVLIAVLVSYFVVRDQLRGQVDTALKEQETVVQRTEQLPSEIPGIPASEGGPAQYIQIVLASGSSYPRQGNVVFPVDARAPDRVDPDRLGPDRRTRR